MAKLSKIETAKCINVSRATLYRYIREGRITVDPDGTIDTAELLRAGFHLHTNGVSMTHAETDTEAENIRLTERLMAAERERDRLVQQLHDATQEKARLLDLLTSQQRLLEAGQKKSLWAKLWRRGWTNVDA
jgi:hypothetical protein